MKGTKAISRQVFGCDVNDLPYVYSKPVEKDITHLPEAERLAAIKWAKAEERKHEGVRLVTRRGADMMADAVVVKDARGNTIEEVRRHPVQILVCFTPKPSGPEVPPLKAALERRFRQQQEQANAKIARTSKRA
jgi:hypothetical protein